MVVNQKGFPPRVNKPEQTLTLLNKPKRFAGQNVNPMLSQCSAWVQSALIRRSGVAGGLVLYLG
jgi:polysaccharide pyruvyl transferase WcaK-like protein